MRLSIDTLPQTMDVRKGPVGLLRNVRAEAGKLVHVLLRHVRQHVKVRGEQGPTLVDVVQMMQTGVGQRDAVIRRRAAADFIHDHLDVVSVRCGLRQGDRAGLTNDRDVASRRIVADSSISTMNVDWFSYRLSAEPTWSGLCQRASGSAQKTPTLLNI